VLDKLLATLDGERDTVIDLQRTLVAVPALGPDNGGSGERVKADGLKEYMAGLGLPSVTEYNAPDPRVSCGHRPNLAVILPGLDTSRTLWVISHLDIVPPGDPALWKTAPYELTVDGDFLYARGVEDNHQGMVSSLLLAKALARLSITPPINYGLLFVADEETGSAYGLDYVAAHPAALFAKNDLFLVPDGGKPNSEQIEVAEKSILWVKVVVKGRQCHGSTPDKGINSLTAAADFILKIAEMKKRFGDVDPLFDPPASTFAPTKKEANVDNVNTIPGRDVFYIDCRVLPHIYLDNVIAALRELGDEVAKTYGVTLKYEFVQKTQAAPATPQDSEIVKRLIPAIKAVYGGSPRPEGIGGGTVAAYLRSRGYHAAVWSTVDEFAHQPNERARISSIIGDAKVMARVLFDCTMR
jgi:succinyl-diaminopimelate desuccinylase